MYVWTLPLASAGGRQLRRTNRLETKTGTTSRGAEGRTLELGTAGGEGEESVREAGGTGVSGRAGGAVVVTAEVLGNKGPRWHGINMNKMTGDEREKKKKLTVKSHLKIHRPEPSSKANSNTQNSSRLLPWDNWKLFLARAISTTCSFVRSYFTGFVSCAPSSRSISPPKPAVPDHSKPEAYEPMGLGRAETK